MNPISKWFANLGKAQLDKEMKSPVAPSPEDRILKAVRENIKAMHPPEDAKEQAAGEDRRNSIMVNDAKRGMQILLFDEGDDSIVKALGALEMAKDMIKGTFAGWRARELQRKGLIVPKKNGNGGLHVR